MQRIKLQVFYFLIKGFNILHFIFLPLSIRHILYAFAGYKISWKTSVQNVRFFSFGKLRIGTNSIINSGVYLDNRRGIEIGNHVVVAHNSKIYTLGHDINDSHFVTKGNSVKLEDFVIVFANALIMPGVTIHKGAVVLPGAVVTKDVPAMTVVGGNPAKKVKDRANLHTERKVKHYWFSI
ncbi:acyltransferase [Lutimonas halocynthiae]|uniref:acyltransferase n=1 Tax=Lutimonas halocynthiae TaxID=1446477 RepID=UPI0025B4E6EB|nr:acyltransferase [Lutimonas halocynthiae]MDN3641814.1 acyltransferase [Lutimonas halocynthiae]